MKRAIRSGAVLLSGLLLVSATRQSRAQDSSSVTGIVSDQTGAVLTSADVTLENTGTKVVFHAHTNSIGSYTIPNVPSGSGYKMTFAHDGFAPLQYSDIYLAVATTRTQNARLSPAGVSTTVEVSAASDRVTLNTADATLGNDLDTHLLNNLPVELRNTPAALFALQPGVTTFQLADRPASSVTGARSDQNNVTLDGLDVNDITTGQTFLIVADAPVDSVEQFRGMVGGFTVNAGPGGGGQFQLVTRSGTNTWHGNVNEYHRDSSTSANGWFSNLAGLHRPHLVRNQFGGNLGGPILRDRAFLFFNFFALRKASSLPQVVTVPLDSFRNGNIRYILDQASNGTGACSESSRANTTPECVGTLTPAQVADLDPLHIGFSSTIQSFLNSRYPHANDLTAGDGLNTGGYRFNAPNPNSQTNYVIRLDYSLSPAMKLFAKVGINRRDAIQTAQFLPSDPVFSNPFTDRSYNYVVGHTWQIGANKVNTFEYGDTIQKYDFPANYAPTGTAVLNFGGFTPTFLGTPYTEQESQRRRIPIPVVRDDFNWLKGTHNLAFGGSFKFIKSQTKQVLDFNFVDLGLGIGLQGLDPTLRPADIASSGTAPHYNYDNAFAFALGHVAQVQTNYNFTNNGTVLPNGTGHVRRYRYYQSELYAADTWKVNRSLSLSYGLRYQLYSVPYETSGAESIQNFSFDQYIAARVAQSSAGVSGDAAVPFITYIKGGKANNAAPLYRPSYKNFAPHLAFAYNPQWMPRVVVRGGAGIVFDRSVVNALNFFQDQSSYLFQNASITTYGGATAGDSLATDPRIGANFAFVNPNRPSAVASPATPNVVGGTPTGLAGYQSNTIIDPNLKDPYSITLNFGIQHQLPANMVLSIDYAGRLGRRLLAQADASQLIDFPDKTSGQALSTAFGNLTKQMRAGQATATAQPWFENQIGAGFTQALYASSLAGTIQNGDFADFVQALAQFGLIDSNIGMASQFAENTFYTNKGFSNYHGMLVSLRKNLTQGLQFDVNYTWSHSIDNTSLIANQSAAAGVGFICDVLRPHQCRGNSDFDITHVINSDFVYQLPIGRNRNFLANLPRWADQFIGGWIVSGIPAWQSGRAFTTVSNAFVAGFSEDAPAIFNGNRGAIAAHVHKAPDGTVQLFRNQAAARRAFTGPIGFQVGSRNNLRGPSAFTMDAGLAKTFAITSDRLNLQFRADAFNVLNHPTFGLPDSLTGNDITNPQFGQITRTTTDPRVVQLGFRLEF